MRYPSSLAQTMRHLLHAKIAIFMAITTLNKPCQLVMARGLLFCPTLAVLGM